MGTIWKGLKVQRLRLWVQIVFFVLVGSIAVSHTLSEQGIKIPFLSTASVHAICPFGGIETLYQLATTGDWLQKIHPSAMVLAGIVAISALLFGGVFCGWICPLGSIQEWLGRLGRRLFKRSYNHVIPAVLDRYLRFIRYGVLILVLYQTARSGKLLFEGVDPYYALFHFWTSETAIAALVILGITLLSSLFIERPWCKYACPYGAVLGLTNPIRLFKIKRTAATCTTCGACNRSCPMNIEVSKTEVVSNHQCISCLRCTSEAACPVAKTVTSGLSGKRIAIIMVALFIGGISMTSALGIWRTTSDQTLSSLTLQDGTTVMDPWDIRGSFTLATVAQQFAIPEADLRQAFGLESNQDLSAIKSKDLEGIFRTEATAENASLEIGNESLQLFVALYCAMPTPDLALLLQEVDLPASAWALLKQRLASPPELLRPYLEGEVAEAPDQSTVETQATKQPQAPAVTQEETKAVTEEKSQAVTQVQTQELTQPKSQTTSESKTQTESEYVPESQINGNTTFYEALKLGITREQIESVLGMPMPAENNVIRSFCKDNGLSFQTVKAALLELLK